MGWEGGMVGGGMVKGASCGKRRGGGRGGGLWMVLVRRGCGWVWNGGGRSR